MTGALLAKRMELATAIRRLEAEHDEACGRRDDYAMDHRHQLTTWWNDRACDLSDEIIGLCDQVQQIDSLLVGVVPR
jgi:hypothetical protein